MTTTALPASPDHEFQHEPILTRSMLWFLAFSVATMASFYLLLSVVPLYAGSATSGTVAAGLATGAMMLSTVLTELVTPRLLARFGYRRMLTTGALLLGLPALALLLSPALSLIIAVSLARGAGLAIVVVAGTALTADIVPEARRGEGLGLYGLAVSIPSIVGLPLGLWVSEQIGYNPVFIAAALISTAGLAAIHALPDHRPDDGHQARVLAGLRSGPIARPTLIFAATTLAAGVFVTFLSLAVPAESRHVAAVALFIQATATTITRWLAGKLGDRYGPHRLLVPAMLLTALGTLCLTAIDRPIAIIAGMTLFGIGFGVAQTTTLTIMFARVPKTAFSQISALWNLAFDAGMGVGAVGFGFLASRTGYPWGFAIIAMILVLTLIPAQRDRWPTMREET